MRMCVCVCVCVDGMNLKYALRWHIRTSVLSVLCHTSYTRTHILKPFEDSEPTGLKVDIADGYIEHLSSCAAVACSTNS